METRMETTIVYWVYRGVMEKKIETTVVYWAYIGIMEKKMEATLVYYILYYADWWSVGNEGMDP